MKKHFLLLYLCILSIIFTQSYGITSTDKEQNDILASAEALFKVMKEKNFPKIWFYLSQGSRNSIINDIYKNIMKHDKEKGRETTVPKMQIEQDFLTGGLIAKAYWESYLNAFDPDMVLEQSRWEMGAIRKDKAYINVRYKKAERPAIIQMFKEDNYWKVGLIETFKDVRR